MQPDLSPSESRPITPNFLKERLHLCDFQFLFLLRLAFIRQARSDCVPGGPWSVRDLHVLTSHHIRHYACSNQCISLSCWLTRTEAGHSHCKVRQCNCSSPQCHGRSWPSQPTSQRAMQNTKAIPESRRAGLIVLRVSDEVNWHPSSLRRQQPNHTKAPSKRQKPK